MAKSTTISFRGGSVTPGQGINAGDIHPLVVNRKLQDGTPQQQNYDPLTTNQHFDFGRVKFRKNGTVVGSYDPFDNDKEIDLPDGIHRVAKKYVEVGGEYVMTLGDGDRCSVAEPDGETVTKSDLLAWLDAGETLIFSFYGFGNYQKRWGIAEDVRVYGSGNSRTVNAHFYVRTADEYILEHWQIYTLNNSEFVTLQQELSINNEATANKVQTLDDTANHYPSCPAVKEAIETAVSSAYHAAGTMTVAQLTSSLLVAANQGNVYNVTDSGTTTADFVEGAGHPITAGDNVGICDVGGGVYKFDLLSGFVDLSGYLAKTGDGSDVTASFTAASTRTNLTTGEKLSILFGKIAKWFSDLKALAFKDKVDTTDIEDDAITADKVKDNETLPVNVSGYASHLRQAKCRFLNTETGYRLMAYLPPKSGYSDTLYTFNIYESRDASSLTSGILKGTLSIAIRNNDGSYQYSSAYRGSSTSDVGMQLRVDANTHGVNLYAAKSNQYYASAVFELLNAYDQYGDEMNATLYANDTLQQSITGTVITPTTTLLKLSGGTIPLADNNGVGSTTQPVYVDSYGEVQACENRIHDLTLQRKIINIGGQMTGRFLLCDRQNWTGTVGSPEFTPVDPYELAEWINRGDVIQVDFTTYDWWGDKFPGLIVEAQCSTLSGDTRVICTNLRVLRQKIVNQQPTVDFQWGDLIKDEDTNTRYMEFQGL